MMEADVFLSRLCTDTSMRAWQLPWLPYSCEGGSANKRELLLRNHNIGLDEVFYWWQLQGGDVHTSLLKQNAFRPVPPLFSLPLCCLWKQQKGQVLEASEPSTPHSARGASSLSRIEFLSAFADCRIHDFSEPEAACLNADREVCRCLFHEEKMPAPTPEAFQAAQTSSIRNRLPASSPEPPPEALQHTQAAPRPASGSLETEDSFFLTGFTSGRNWRDVHLWKEGDLRVFEVSIEDTVKAIQEADRFPVTQMLEVSDSKAVQRTARLKRTTDGALSAACSLLHSLPSLRHSCDGWTPFSIAEVSELVAAYALIGSSAASESMSSYKSRELLLTFLPLRVPLTAANTGRNARL
ncbi:TBC domain-containing protein kinase (incomplete catalytic triad) [Cyclospora cayetanensis]|uniref:TBC domain-containing protein kinase (Incomplete catalytic triad) n=1 Tax=Cyclospora cayetanensis TaxID=88456 RepID=A0A1D3CXP9_9EIME|nr:TBC domain-containing protein kinase (incomplete catalytic triad) [Cyclospora cayetanensis]